MVSRPIIFSLLLAAGHGASTAAVSSSPSPPRHLRTVPQATALESASSVDIPDIANTRSLKKNSENIPDIADTRSLQEDEVETNSTEITTNSTNSTDRAISVEDRNTIQLPMECVNLLAASANEYGKLKKENYFVFTDGMSNGYYTFNNMSSYSDLPMPNKFGFVTLTCQCHAFGGRGNCCQGDRAKLDVSGIEDPQSMSTQKQKYLIDICSVTSDSIGDDVLPPTGELPTTARPTTTVAPSLHPSQSIWPSDSPSGYPTGAPIVGTMEPTKTQEPTVGDVGEGIPGAMEPAAGNGSGNGNTRTSDGLSSEAWAGIAIGGAFVLTLIAYLFTDRKQDEEDRLAIADRAYDLEAISPSNSDKGKQLLTITTDGEMDPDRPPCCESPDATNSMTAASDVDSIQTMGTSGNNSRSAYYANNSLLPGRPDDDSVFSSSEGPSFFADGDDGIEEGVEVTDPRNLSHASQSAILNTSDDSGGSLDHAIESGNWEAVAASAAAMVKQNEGASSVVGESRSV